MSEQTKRSRRPTRKTAAGTVGAAVGAIIVWALTVAGLDPPAAVESAVVVVSVFGLSWVVPERSPADSARRGGRIVG